MQRKRTGNNDKPAVPTDKKLFLETWKTFYERIDFLRKELWR